jgi:SAM-dependent methyltransferase
VGAAEEWARALGAWALPEEILARAPNSPWGFPPGIFAAAAREALAEPMTPTHRRARQALPDGGVVLDVGSGAGAASLPLAPPATRIIAVDQSAAMLAQMKDLAVGRVEVEAIEGSWPDVADQVGVADVAVCANVAYNVTDLDRFLAALTDRARRRAVLELTAVHPQTSLSWLWKHFWDLDRPVTPTASDAIAVVREGLSAAVEWTEWSRRHPLLERSEAEMVASVRRRLCLTPAADQEIRQLLSRSPPLVPPAMVTAWWPGRA